MTCVSRPVGLIQMTQADYAPGHFMSLVRSDVLADADPRSGRVAEARAVAVSALGEEAKAETAQAAPAWAEAS
jgi:hypothetical protein